MKFKKYKYIVYKYLPIILVVLILYVFFLYMYQKGIINIVFLKKNQLLLDQFTQHNKMLAMVIFCVVLISGTILSIPLTSFMAMCSGFLFGIYTGTILTALGSAIGSTLFYIVIRMCSENIKHKIEKKVKIIKRIQKDISKKPFFYLLLIHCIPIFPFFAINIAAALFSIPWKIFFFSALVGGMPVFFAYASFGYTISQVLHKPSISYMMFINKYSIISLIIIVLFVFLSFFYYGNKFNYAKDE